MKRFRRKASDPGREAWAPKPTGSSRNRWASGTWAVARRRLEPVPKQNGARFAWIAGQPPTSLTAESHRPDW